MQQLSHLPTETRRTVARAYTVQRVERRARALELRRAGCTFDAIGRELQITPSAAQRLVTRALRGYERGPVEALVEESLRDLELCWSKTLAILNAIHPLVSGGSVVYDLVRDAKGDPVLDPRTNEALRMPLSDAGPVLKAIERLQSLSESKRRLLGIDKPQQVHMTTDGDPMRVVAGMDSDKLERALAAGLARLRRPEVIDVTPVESVPGDQPTPNQ